MIIILHSVSQFCSFFHYFSTLVISSTSINLTINIFSPPFSFCPISSQILSVCFPLACLGLSPFPKILPLSSPPQNSFYPFLFKFLNHPFSRDKNCPLHILSLLFSILSACQNSFFVTLPSTLFQSKTHAFEVLLFTVKKTQLFSNSYWLTRVCIKVFSQEDRIESADYYYECSSKDTKKPGKSYSQSAKDCSYNELIKKTLRGYLHPVSPSAGCGCRRTEFNRI